MLNNIIRGNTPRTTSEDNLYFILGAYPSMKHNNIEMPFVTGLNNINQPSKFVRPTVGAGISELGYEADWRLKAESPEIDAGTLSNIADIIGDKDVYGNKRLQGQAIDIGASEYMPPSKIETIVSDKHVKLFPNPFSEQIWVEMDNMYKNARYQIVSVSGQIVEKSTLKESINLIETSHLINGYYILSILGNDNKVIFSSKIVKNQ